METSPLPTDLAHPRRDHRDRFDLIAGIACGGVLLAVLAALCTFWLATR